MARPSAELVKASQNVLRKVRPGLNDRQLAAAADVIAAEVEADAETITPEDIRRGRAAVKEAIKRNADPAGTSLG